MVTSDGLELLGEGAVGYAVSYPRPGWAEQDPALWEAALRPAIGAALAAAGCRASEVAALGIAGQLDGCVAVGDDGEALAPCLVWMDRRAHDQLPELPDDFALTTGLVADGGHMAAKIRWLMGHGYADASFHQPVSYLLARLTGAALFDPGLASTTMLYSLAAGDYSAELLDRFAIERAQLPGVGSASECAGTLTRVGVELTGLPAATRVAVGTGDDFATPLGAGMIAPGPIACVVGTAEVVGALSAGPIVDREALVETHAYVNEYFFVENPGWLSGGALLWLDSIIGAGGAAAIDALAAEVAPGADGLLFLPALSGAMAPRWIAGARGCFHGLTPAHGRAHLARAVLEGCAFAMRDVIDRLVALGIAADSLRLLGGGARSPL